MAQTATIIDLDDVRRRRRAPAAAPTPATPAIAWVPVWVVVPVWTMA